MTTKKPDTVKRFVVGETYVTRYPGDHELKITAKVVSRTASFVTLTGERDRRCKVYVHDGCEICYPDGRYSMCPVLTAARPKPSKAASKPKVPSTANPRLPAFKL